MTPLIELNTGFHWFFVVMIVSVLLGTMITMIGTKEARAIFITAGFGILSLFGFAFTGFPTTNLPPLKFYLFCGALSLLSFYLTFLEIRRRIEDRKRRARRIEP